MALYSPGRAMYWMGALRWPTFFVVTVVGTFCCDGTLRVRMPGFRLR